MRETSAVEGFIFVLDSHILYGYYKFTNSPFNSLISCIHCLHLLCREKEKDKIIEGRYNELEFLCDGE